MHKYIEQLEKSGEIHLRIKARPGADKTVVKGILDGAEGETIKIDIAAAPEKGKANIALIRYLADEFKTDKKNIKIISGAGDKIKLIKINNQ